VLRNRPALRRAATAAVLAVAAALTTTGAVSGTASAATAHDPHGMFDVTLHGRHAHLWGAAADPDNGSGPTRVMLFISGWQPRIVTTNPDTRGYGYWVWLPYGTHRVAAMALNHGAGQNVTLGNQSVVVHNYAARNPHGTAWLTRYPKMLSFSGVAADPSAYTSPLTILLYHDGKLIDVARTNPTTKRYSVWSTPHEGTNYYSVVAVNVGWGTGNVLLNHTELGVGPTWANQYSGARRLAADMIWHYYRWDAYQMQCLDRIWTQESNWQPYAANPSGAYGIPQALPGSKMSTAGADWRTNPATQIKWGIRYIKLRYGSPAAAWSYHLSAGSY
jgi:hypothetical protein